MNALNPKRLKSAYFQKEEMEPEGKGVYLRSLILGRCDYTGSSLDMICLLMCRQVWVPTLPLGPVGTRLAIRANEQVSSSCVVGSVERAQG